MPFVLLRHLRQASFLVRMMSECLQMSETSDLGQFRSMHKKPCATYSTLREFDVVTVEAAMCIGEVEMGFSITADSRVCSQ